MSKLKKQVLVADDDAAILEVVQLILEDEGYEVITTIDGGNIYTMEKNYPDLLLLDIWMSGMDGRDICKHIKSQEHTKHIPIIMISANKDTGKISKDAGANDFLTKPFEINDLISMVKKYTENK